ncbi:MAG: DNA repair protein RecN [Clostridiales bacterium]|nr:DNA repair protein RecN [Clostridiales bacterium]
MLKSLSIENVAVIEKAVISFDGGLNILTGETGAGKSIVIDSLNMVLGERTSRDLVRTGAESAQVTALFTDVSNSVLAFLHENGIACDGELYVVRRVTASGKSGCRINSMPVTAAVLRELGKRLVNIHGQHDSQQLLDPAMHIHFIDRLSAEQPLYDDYYQTFRDFMAVRKQLKVLTRNDDDNDSRLEILNFQISELEQADIKAGEREALNRRKEQILAADGMRKLLASFLNFADGSDDVQGAVPFLQNFRENTLRYSETDAQFDQFYKQSDTLTEQMVTLCDRVRAKADDLDADPRELEAVEERLDMLYKLGLKYGGSEESMLAFLEDARQKRDAIAFSDEEIERLSKEYDRLYSAVMQKAEALSAARKKTAAQFEQQVKAQLVFLDMPNVRFCVQFSRGKLSAAGFDDVEFLISTNPGMPPKPLAKIASGGELSRIMLAVKTVLAKNDDIATLIFDEIDTGVSGDASRKIGLKLKEVSASAQVICVTHSAQIAAFADRHLFISKAVENGQTFTKVTPLDLEARQRELARIMGGNRVTQALLQSAREMLTKQEDNDGRI